MQEHVQKKLIFLNKYTLKKLMAFLAVARKIKSSIGDTAI